MFPLGRVRCPPKSNEPSNEQEQIASLERLCGQQALELDRLRSEVDVLKKPHIESLSLMSSFVGS